MMWTFHLSMPSCFGFRAFQSFGQPPFLFVHPLFTLECHLGIYQNSRQTKKFKKTVKSLNNFWKQSMFTTLFWLSINSLNLPKRRDTFQMIQKHPTQCRNFLENTGSVLTICKFSTHSWNFPHNLETFKTLWEHSRQ